MRSNKNLTKEVKKIMPKCRHKVQYGSVGHPGCTSKKMKDKPYETPAKVKCGYCSAMPSIWEEDERAKQKCPMHEKFKD